VLALLQHSWNETIQIAHFLCIGRICTDIFACGANTPTEAAVARTNRRKQSMDTSDITVTYVNVMVAFVPPMGAAISKVPAVGLRYEMRTFVFVCKGLSSQTLRGVIVVILCTT
jgi:hypothetical protein